MAGIEVKSFDSPDETRPFEGRGQLEVVSVMVDVGEGSPEAQYAKPS